VNEKSESRTGTLHVGLLIFAMYACLACAHFLNPEMPDWLYKLEFATGCVLMAGTVFLLKRDIERMDAEIEILKAEEERLRRRIDG